MRWMLGIGAVVGAGCHNPCQQICGRMADYAEECGFTVPDGDLGACLEREGSDLTPEDRQACRDFGDPESIRAQWSCDEIAQYWSSGST